MTILTNGHFHRTIADKNSVHCQPILTASILQKRLLFHINKQRLNSGDDSRLEGFISFMIASLMVCCFPQ